MIPRVKLTNQERVSGETSKRPHVTSGQDDVAVKKTRKNEVQDDYENNSPVTEVSKNLVAHQEPFSFIAKFSEIEKPIVEQSDKTRSFFEKISKDSFDKKVPYVFSYDEGLKSKVVFDVAGFVQSAGQYGLRQQQPISAADIWHEHFATAKFFAFLDNKSPPILIGSIKDLDKKGIGDSVLLSSLLTPSVWPEVKSQVFYLYLFSSNLISPKFKAYADVISKEVSSEDIKWQKEELLIDFAGSGSSRHLKALLKQGVSPDSFSDLFGVYAIHVARANKRAENVKALLKYGADPEVELQEPAV